MLNFKSCCMQQMLVGLEIQATAKAIMAQRLLFVTRT